MDIVTRRPIHTGQRPGKSCTVAQKPIVSIGLDIGSTSSDLVVLKPDGSVLYSEYQRTLGRPFETAIKQLETVERRGAAWNIKRLVVTGSAGRYFAQAAGLSFINEVPAQAAAIRLLYPQIETATVIEMGGQDSKLIFLGVDEGRKVIRDFALNTVCAAGTGSFLDQQAQRLGIEIEGEFASIAMQSKNPARIAGRCSVFAKSDMIHLGQLATPMPDILAGLCLGLARNLKSNLGNGRQFIKPVIFTGGVAANGGVVRALEEVLELSPGELIVPYLHFYTGAIGAVMAEQGAKASDSIDLADIIKKVRRHVSDQKQTARKRLAQPTLPVPKSPVYGQTLKDVSIPVRAYLGVDVGSISTNVVVMDEDRRVLAKSYVMTAGRPLEAVQQGLREVWPVVAGKVTIAGAATTGSGRYLTGDFIGADTVINEITAQAAGAAIVNPGVDTIFEIGGQDSKYISLENGVVVDFEMNHACAAGTGSFLEEQAQRLGIDIKGQFSELAFKSVAPARLGERCTVFMESDLLNYQQQGATTADLVAGLAYSIASNYLNRVVGRRKIGSNICFQGGTAFNKAVWAAFETITGKSIMVPDHHEVTGALGAAFIASDFMRSNNVGQSRFKGFENLDELKYTVASFTCEHCSNNCEIKQVQIGEGAPLFYGSRCDRYNIKKQENTATEQDAFEFRKSKLFECAGISKTKTDSPRGTIGLPLALGNWQMLPLFSRFFKELGFSVLVSPQTTKSIIRSGVEAVTAQTCFPVKVVYGHVEYLLKKKADYIFLPSIVSMARIYPDNQHNHLCPYVQTVPYQVRTAFLDKLAATKLLTPVVRFADGGRVMQDCFTEIAAGLSVAGKEAQRALAVAMKAQDDFETSCRTKGREILAGLKPDEKLFVLVSRPYNGCDAGVNLELPRKFADIGAKLIPIDMLDLADVELSDTALHSRMYWRYGQHILRAAEVIRRDQRLYAVYLSNFSCGPDSFLMTFFKEIMGNKPCLQIELDEHSADAGVLTRLEAFFESLKNYQPGSRIRTQCAQAGTCGQKHDRTIYIPWMGDCAHGLAATFRAYGRKAEVLPVADEAALIEGRKFTTGKECLPCAITSGDMLKLLSDTKTKRDEVAFFMPGGIGPCRFGVYSCLHELVLKYAGFADVPVLAPNQDVNFYKELTRVFGKTSMWGFTRMAWIATVGIDLIQKVLLLIRPYAIDSAALRASYEKSLARWLGAVEQRSSISDLTNVMAEIGGELAAIKCDEAVSKPRIGIVGEIYVRSHNFSNQNLIANLEALGAAVEVASLAEWIYYTNVCRHDLTRRRRRWGDFARNEIENFFQRKYEKALAKPLEKFFGPLAEEPVEHVLDLAKPYIHRSFEGEAILSIGKIVEYHRKGFGGVINVMPFTCMPSTIVTTQTMRISADCGNMPVLNISFDGNSDATLITRLEAFVEQVRQRSKPAGVQERTLV